MDIMEDVKPLGINDYLAILKRRKKQLIIPALIIFVICAGFAVALPSVYRSEATILIEQQEVPNELVRSTVTSYAAERIQVISQRVMTTENLSKIIDGYGLYENKRDTVSMTILSEKLRKNIELEIISADVVDPRSGRPTKATIAFKLSFSDKDPRIAQKVTNELVSLYRNENLRQRTQSALETSSFLSSEANKLKKDLLELESSLATFKEKHVNNLPELQEINIRLMERNERELSEITQQINNLEERKIYLESELAQINPITDIYNSSGSRVMGTEDRIRILQSEYLQLETRYTDQHPTLIKIRDEIEVLKKEFDENSSNQKRISQSDNPAYLQLETQLNAAEVELVSLRDMKAEITNKIRDYENRLIQSPQVEREYRNLTRDYENAKAKYQEVKSKQLEADIAKSLESERKGERFSLIEPPQLPEKPDKPNRLVITFIGFVFGLFGGVGNVALKESIDDTIHGSKDVEIITSAQPLAIIPLIKSQDRAFIKTHKILLISAVIVAVIVVGITLIHSFIMPFDVLWPVIMRKIGLQI
ncbi:MAG: lipopolysaccharide biosynthesis protein [Candidatus Thiodiazotropha sp.]